MYKHVVLIVCEGIMLAILSHQVFAQSDVLPFLETIPKTQFSCRDRIYGYYADVEAKCQVFHVCLNNRKWSFLCPNQTIFNQAYLVCDYPDSTDCGDAEQLYSVNENFGKVEGTTKT